jgi:hypothetical protein
MTDDPKQSQLDKFKETAREIECNHDEMGFDEGLKKLVKVGPKAEKPE